jgi:carbonic anhydrase/acetyltransferase-like protein (isoleucine patch superfamily)
VHGPCIIGQGCFVGFSSVVFKSALADKVFIGHLAVVEGVVAPERRCVPSVSVINHKRKMKALKMISQGQEIFIQQVMDANMRLAKSAVGVKLYAQKVIA